MPQVFFWEVERTWFRGGRWHRCTTGLHQTLEAALEDLHEQAEFRQWNVYYAVRPIEDPDAPGPLLDVEVPTEAELSAADPRQLPLFGEEHAA